MQDFNEPTSDTSESFTELFRGFGGGRLFLIGIILYTVGAGVSNLFSLPGILRDTVYYYNVVRIVLLLAMAPFVLNAIGLWIIFAASKSQGLPKMIPRALTTLKISAVVTLIYTLLMVLFVLFVFFTLATWGGVLTLFLIALILTGILFALYIIFYFVPFLRILRAVKHGITNNTLKPLRGVIPFTVISCISIGVTALYTLYTLSIASIAVTDFSALPLLFTSASLAGNMIIVVVINQFNRKLKDTKSGP